MRLTLRLNIVFWSVMIAAIAIIMLISRNTPDNLGVLKVFTFLEGEIVPVFMDYDTGVQTFGVGMPFESNTAPYRPELSQMPDGAGNVSVIQTQGETERIIGTYTGIPLMSNGVFWHERNQSLMLIYRNSDNLSSEIALMDSTTGALSSFAHYENFAVGHLNFSPDGNYLLLRESQSQEYRSVLNPRPTLLINRYTGAAQDLGLAVYAYWSPDSQSLAIGYETENRFHITVERYQVATGEITAYPVTTSQEDVPYFNDNFLEVYGVVWSPDSQKLAVTNRHTSTISLVDFNGAVTSFEGGRIFPRVWSPDSHSLLGVGYDGAGKIGAFIFTDGNQYQLESERTIMEQLSSFVWSPDSRYVAVLMRAGGVQAGQSLTIHDLQGKLAAERRDLSGVAAGYFVLEGSVVWRMNGYPE